MLEHRPADVLQVLNDALLQRDEPESFCSALFLRLRPGQSGASGELVLAGHPRPLVRRSSGEVVRLDTGGSLLGIVEGDVTRRVALSLDRGDVLLLYTDGVTEARRGADLFGEDRLAELLEHTAGGAEDVAQAVEDAVDTFGDDGRADDVAILTISPTN
jgi:serine phosphatase RsbU (regulator of sigma subunit)